MSIGSELKKAYKKSGLRNIVERYKSTGMGGLAGLGAAALLPGALPLGQAVLAATAGGAAGYYGGDRPRQQRLAAQRHTEEQLGRRLQAGDELKELKEQLTDEIFKSEEEMRVEKYEEIGIDDVFNEQTDLEEEEIEEYELEGEEPEEEEPEEISAEEFAFIMELNGMTTEIADALIAQGFTTIRSIAEAKLDVIANIPEIGNETAEIIQDSALEMLENLR